MFFYKRQKSNHISKLLITIITSISLLFLSTRATHAAGMNCVGNDVYIVNGEIVVKQYFRDFPVENMNTRSPMIIFENANGVRGSAYTVATTTNIVKTRDPSPGCSLELNLFNVVDIQPICNSGEAYAIYTIDRFTSQRIARDIGTGNVDIDAILKLQAPTETDRCNTGAAFHLTQQQVQDVLSANPATNAPQGACPSGCPQDQACLWSGAGNISDPATWSCQQQQLGKVNVQGSCGNQEIDTAIGCVPVETKQFTKGIVGYGVGLAGLSALVIMLIATIIMVVGGSNPEQVKKAKEIFGGAIKGLLFIIFSAILLKIIKEDIIKF